MTRENSYLFVIGIDHYKSPAFDRLFNAVRDAKAIAEVLTSRYSFELFEEPIFDEEANRENILEGFNRLVLGLTEQDSLVIYFSGHGLMAPFTNTGYWVPHEAVGIAGYIPNSTIKDYLGAMKAKHIFLVADSCFSGTFLTRTRSGRREQSYSDMDSRPSRWMLASGGEEKVLDGEEGRGSPFHQRLMRVLTANESRHLSVQEIIRYVSVLTANDSRQKPIGAPISNIGHEEGELVFTLDDASVCYQNSMSNGFPNTPDLAKELRSIYRSRSKIAAGKEIVMVESFTENADLLILENFRFDDEGKKKLLFHGDKVRFPERDAGFMDLIIHARAATWESLNRLFEANADKYKDKRIIAMNASEEIDTVEETEAAMQQQDVIQDLIDANPEIMRCLHCGNIISSNDSYLIEIDEQGLMENAGNVHADCRRPADRILGQTAYQDLPIQNLVSFDYKKWMQLLKRGQGILHFTKRQLSERQPTVILSWNREHNFNAGEYCMKMLLEDGSSSYVRLGKEIHRFPAGEIDEEVKAANDSIKKAADAGDPLCLTNKQKIFGSYQQLLKHKHPDELILKVTGHEKAKFSQQIASLTNEIENDYTSLGLVIDLGSGKLINFGNCIPLVSNPLEFGELFQNWKKAGYHAEKYSITIIETDKELDLHLISFFDEGMQPIIDPYFDEQKELVRGIYITDFREVKELAAAASFPLNRVGEWKAGDRVEIVFPEVNTDRHPTGILLTDEFNDEGERCVIFCPIEDGAMLAHLKYKMPVRLLKRSNA